jgi:hypothetical protein
MKAFVPVLHTVLLTTILLGVTACEDRLIPTRTFIIRKGAHFSSTRVSESLQSDVLEFYASFDETAIYDLGDQALQSSKNKLLGFSDCNSLHHENSARFAWQWFNNRLEIYAYCYVNGDRIEQYIGTVGIGEKNKYAIRLMPDHYEFRLNDQDVVKIDRANTCNTGFYYMLWPYFGGAIPAPHDIVIVIQRIY